MNNVAALKSHYHVNGELEMDLQTSLIDLDSIEQVEENSFSIDPAEQAAEIQMLAKTVILIKGLLRIPVVEQIGIESYKLISGHFDYYSYLRARELDPSLPDRLRVFIVNPKKEIAKGILEQLEAIDSLQTKAIDKNISDPSLKLLTQLSNTINFEVLERLNQLEGVEKELAEIKHMISNSEPSVVQKPVYDPELGKTLEQSLSILISSLATGELEANIEIKKPREIKPILDPSSLTDHELKKICKERSLIPIHLSNLEALYSGLTIDALKKEYRSYGLSDKDIKSSNKNTKIQQLLAHHQSQLN